MPAVVGVTLGTTGCTQDSARARCGRAENGCTAVSKRDFGPDWPFSVAKGRLACRRGGAVTFATGNSVFGLNERARDRGHAPPYPIWLWDYAPQAADLRVRESLARVVDRGRELCEKPGVRP